MPKTPEIRRPETNYPAIHPSIILASSSAYRQQLLRQLGLPFSAMAPDIDESPQSNEQAEALVQRLAYEKAWCIFQQNPDHIVIGSDQLALDPWDQWLNKPQTQEKAFAQLRACSGRRVRFLTSLCVLSPHQAPIQDRVVTQVDFRHLTDQQIEHYLQREQPFDCAGSFKAEGLGIALFERLTSDDPSALIGLPLIALTQALQQLGIDPLSHANSL